MNVYILDTIHFNLTTYFVIMLYMVIFFMGLVADARGDSNLSHHRPFHLL